MPKLEWKALWLCPFHKLLLIKELGEPEGHNQENVFVCSRPIRFNTSWIPTLHLRFFERICAM